METQMINLSIPKKLLQLLDSQAKAELKTRSELLRDAVRSYLVRLNQWEEIFSFGRAQAAKVKIKPSQLEKVIDDYRQGN